MKPPPTKPVPKCVFDKGRLAVQSQPEVWQDRAEPLTKVWRHEDKDTDDDKKFIDEWHKSQPSSDAVMLEWTPSPDDVRLVAKSFRWAKAVSSDSLHPRHVALLTDSLLWAMITIIGKCFEQRMVPALLKSLHMRLIGKQAPDGSYKGERAVGLFTPEL